MENFLGFAIPGIPFGCTYALVAVGLVLTYQATGVFNFAFGAQAYVSAFIFTLLVQNEHMSVLLAFVLSVVLLAPALGLIFDRYLFRKIPNSNTTAKLVTGITLFVGIPALLPVIFGSNNQYNPPSILFNPDIVYFRVAGTPINGISLSSVVVTAVVLLALVLLMRLTPLGLQMRGAVESRRLVQLDGVNSGRVVAVAWAVSSLMAGLAGVMLAPLYAQLQSQDYATLVVAAFAAAAWAVLRSMPIAAVVGILMGVADTVLQGYLPPSSVWSSATLSSLPFIVLVAALLIVPGLRKLGEATDPLASIDPPTPPTTAALRAPQIDRIIRVAWYILLAAFIVSMLTWMPKTWENVFNAGLAFSVIFLSITLITGMGGQLSLCQAMLAGVGAFTAAQLANHLGLSLLVGGLVGAVAAGVVAVVLAVASLRLRGLGLALMTIAAALFFDSAVFPQLSTSNGSPLSVQPKWVGLGILNPNGHAFFVMAMVVLVVCIIGRAPGAQGDDGPVPVGHARQRDGGGRPGHQPDLAAGADLRPLRGGGRHRRHAPDHPAAVGQRGRVQLPALAGLRGHRGDHRGEHGGRGHQRRVRVRGHPAIARPTSRPASAGTASSSCSSPSGHSPMRPIPRGSSSSRSGGGPCAWSGWSSTPVSHPRPAVVARRCSERSVAAMAPGAEPRPEPPVRGPWSTPVRW